MYLNGGISAGKMQLGDEISNFQIFQIPAQEILGIP
jgi:hypothetical protein